MGKVRVLPPQVANAIAAGEVVERPASVVKELVENSIDAGARRITVEVEKSGLALIRVTDDGSGMSRQDAALAFERHATSKVSTSEDLRRITTLGFRGEALPSIAAVARVRMLTREPGAEEGTQVRVEGGGAPKVAPGPARPGTSVDVHELFYNVPARRKFLKSAAAEGAAIGDVVSTLALANAGVHLRYDANGREVLNAPPAQDPLDRILAVLGMDVADEMLAVQAQCGKVRLAGHLSRVSLTRSSAADQYFIINGRPVRSKALAATVRAAYKGRVMVGRHPVVVLRIDLPPEEVDVNVHPAKSEVRFQKERELCALVEASLRRALESQARVAVIPLRAREGAPLVAEVRASAAPLEPAAARARAAPQAAAPPAYQKSLGEVATGLAGLAPPEALADVQRRLEEARARFPHTGLPRLLPLAQIGDKYILARTDAGLAIIDQHAAAERFAYESLSDALASGGVTSQQLIDPAILTLHPREIEFALERAQDLRAVGFEVERFGPRQLRVAAVPAMLGDHAEVSLVSDILTEAFSETGPSPDEELRDRLVAATACHYSLRAGRAIDLREMARVVENLYRCRNPYHCIHGRPTVVLTTIEDLDRMFKRTGPG